MMTTASREKAASLAAAAGIPGVEIERKPKLIIDCDTEPSIPVGLRSIERHYPQGQIPWNPNHFHLFRTREQRGETKRGKVLVTTCGLRTVSTARMMAAIAVKREVPVNAGAFNFFNKEGRHLIPVKDGDITSVSLLGTLFVGPCERTVVATFSLLKEVWAPDYRDLADPWGPGDAVLVFSRWALENLPINIPD